MTRGCRQQRLRMLRRAGTDNDSEEERDQISRLLNTFIQWHLTQWMLNRKNASSHCAEECA